MAFLAAINARKKAEPVPEPEVATRPSVMKARPSAASLASPSSESPRTSMARARPSVDSSSVRPSIAVMTRPSMAARPSLLKRGSISFSIADIGTPLTQGREGPLLRSMSQKIRDNKDLTDEKVELLYEAFQTFPLNEEGVLTAQSLGDYYSRCGLVFTPDECDKMMSLFVGASSTSINFEDFALAYIRCEKTLPVNSVLKVPVVGELNIADKDSARSRELFFDALGIGSLGEEHLNHLVNGLQKL